MQLSNAVYNKIRNFSVKDSKRRARVHDKAERSTAEQAMDPADVILAAMVAMLGLAGKMEATSEPISD